jgi:hypothetical protein
MQLIQVVRYNETRIYMEELLKEPKNADLLYNLGLCYLYLGQFEKGI